MFFYGVKLNLWCKIKDIMNILFTRRHKYQRNFCANVCLENWI